MGSSDSAGERFRERVRRLLAIARDPAAQATVSERHFTLAPDPVNRLKSELLDTVARANRCRTGLFWHKARNGRPVIDSITVYGIETDIDATLGLWTAMETTRALRWRVHARADGRRKANAAFRDGYYRGFADEIANRYARLRRSMTTDAYGGELVALREDQIDEYVDSLKWDDDDEDPWFAARRTSPAAYRLGRADGAEARLGSTEVDADTGGRTLDAPRP